MTAVMPQQPSFLKNYSSILLLLGGITLGSIAGYFLGERAAVLKPVGVIFLNLLFTAVVPMIFFAIASTFASLSSGKKFGRLISTMLLVFLGTILTAASLTLIGVSFFPFTGTIPMSDFVEMVQSRSAGEHLTELLTVGDFFQLLSRKSMLALIIFSILFGLSTANAGIKAAPFHHFLSAGYEVMKKLLSYIMKLAPVGLGAYFAYQVGVFGPQLFGTYASALALCYGICICYYGVMYSVYAYIAGGISGVKRFWLNNITPSATALGTCSSIATIPANLEAARRMGVPDHIGNLVLPLGATLHKNGSAIATIIKIAVIFAILQQPLAGVETILIALLVCLIVSIVEGGIPSGGYAGEMMIVAAYSFPPETLPVIMIIGTLVDPIVTLLNATGDNAAAMLVSRFSNQEQAG